MSLSRRSFLRTGSKNLGMLAATSLLWSHQASALELSESLSGSNYKAVVVITLLGGNDGNNTVIPLDTDQYAAYARLRQYLALKRADLLPLKHAVGDPAYGLHPALTNVASLYNSNKALLVANVGPIVRPSTKQEIVEHDKQYPGGSRSHTEALEEWENGQVKGGTGWGGRVADFLTSASGSLPPVLTTAQSRFTVGASVQAVAVQGGAAFAALPPAITNAVAEIAKVERFSNNLLVSATASLRSRALTSQQLLNQAIAYDSLKTSFGSSALHRSLKTIAKLIAGRSVVGASRQIFYTQQGGYDNHENQGATQGPQLADLDQGIAAFLAALDEVGMSDQVLICTHSDFCRTLQPNTSGGTDHAWGNHHFLIGGGISGGRIVGAMPDMEFGGPLDLDGTGVWIPTQSVTQMAGGVGQWLGLTAGQVSSVFPDLQNFSAGVIRLT